MTRMRICNLLQDEIGYRELLFFSEMKEHLDRKYGYDSHFTPDRAYSTGHTVWLALSGDAIKGCLILDHFLDPFTDEKVAFQRLFYSTTPRATKLLMQHFLDYGKKNANSIMSVLTDHTNLKESSLTKLGFVKFETVYKLEV